MGFRDQQLQRAPLREGDRHAVQDRSPTSRTSSRPTCRDALRSISWRTWTSRLPTCRCFRPTCVSRAGAPAREGACWRVTAATRCSAATTPTRLKPSRQRLSRVDPRRCPDARARRSRGRAVVPPSEQEEGGSSTRSSASAHRRDVRTQPTSGTIAGPRLHGWAVAKARLVLEAAMLEALIGATDVHARGPRGARPPIASRRCGEPRAVCGPARVPGRRHHGQGRSHEHGDRRSKRARRSSMATSWSWRSRCPAI